MTFSGKISFPSKVPEFLHVLFNLVEKHSPVSFFDLNALVQLCCVHCARFNILSLFFSETKCKPAKKIQGIVLLLHQKAHAKLQVLLEENKFYPKKSLASLLHQAIQLCYYYIGHHSHLFSQSFIFFNFFIQFSLLHV